MGAVLSGVGVSEGLSAFVADVVAPMGGAKRRGNAEVYVAGMLAQGDRKSLQPVVERQGGTLAAYESLQQFIADSPWDPVPVMQAVAERVCPQIEVLAWILDDTGYPKQGKHSPGVQRQYSGTLGKVGNCQIGVSLHAAGARGTLPLGWSLYLPKEWCADTPEAAERRRKAKIPKDTGFKTKPQLALALAQACASWQITQAPILGDAAYGINTELRSGLHELGLPYVLSIEPTINVLDVDTNFTEPSRRGGSRGPASGKLVADRRAVSAERFVTELGTHAWQQLAYRDAVDVDEPPLYSRFTCQRVIAAHPVLRDGQDPREEWLIAEWPLDSDKPSDYWISNLPADTDHEQLARLARMRWMIELDYKQLKGHLGLDHYEGRSYLGWHHHATLVTIAHGWLTEQRLNPFHPRPA